MHDWHHEHAPSRASVTLAVLIHIYMDTKNLLFLCASYRGGLLRYIFLVCQDCTKTRDQTSFFFTAQ